jgi:hypothetical protein
VSSSRVPPWAVPVGLAIVGVVVLWQLAKETAKPDVGEAGTGASGLVPKAIDQVVGGGQFSKTVHTEQLQLGSGSLPIAPAPTSSKSPVDFISGGIVDPPNKGTVSRALYGYTVRLKLELSNSGVTDWVGAVRLEVYEDYLFSDEQGSYSSVYAVPKGTTRQFDIDYRLTATDGFRNPNLFINVFVGTKFLGKHEVRVT